MGVTKVGEARWLLLVFSLPAKRASQRVAIWRKMRRYGTLPLKSSGYVLPNLPANQERMEWLAAAIRGYKGQASVVQAQSFDDLPDDRLRRQFTEARTRDYQRLLHEVKKLGAISPERTTAGLNRIRRQFLDLQEIDFFGCPLHAKLDKALARAGESGATARGRGRRRKSREYTSRVWVTRPRPGIDRVSSAWLIRTFIDPKASFVFDADPSAHPGAIPFDMFCAEGFGHRGEDCTFETLCKHFGIPDERVRRIAEIIHDADLGDEKFARAEGQGLDKVLNGWAKQDLPDAEILRRGIDLIEGLYEGLA
jgi:hypothetical protein